VPDLLKQRRFDHGFSPSQDLEQRLVIICRIRAWLSQTGCGQSSNDLHPSRLDCQKKKNSSKSSPRRLDAIRVKKTNAPGCTAPAR
jgi:hypothetical protein